MNKIEELDNEELLSEYISMVEHHNSDNSIPPSKFAIHDLRIELIRRMEKPAEPAKKEEANIHPLEFAEAISQVNWGRSGTWGGNVLDENSVFSIYKLKDLSETDKLLFIEAYLAKERQKLILWLMTK